MSHVTRSQGNTSFASCDLYAPVFSKSFLATGTSRRWCFTYNNPQSALVDVDVKEWKATYVVFQLEMGESGTLHYQGYIEMPKPVRFTHFKILEGAHFEKAAGAPMQARAYCMKEDSRIEGPWEFGVWRGDGTRAGTRTDLIALRDAIKSGKRGRELLDDDALAPTALSFPKAVELLNSTYVSAVSRADIRVVFHYGPAGTGKTMCCHSDDVCCFSFCFRFFFLIFLLGILF